MLEIHQRSGLPGSAGKCMITGGFCGGLMFPLHTKVPLSYWLTLHQFRSALQSECIQSAISSVTP